MTTETLDPEIYRVMGQCWRVNCLRFHCTLVLSKGVAAFGAVALTAAAATTAILVKSQFKAIDSIAKVSDRLNIQTEALTGLQHAAQISGVENTVFNNTHFSYTVLTRHFKRLYSVKVPLP